MNVIKFVPKSDLITLLDGSHLRRTDGTFRDSSVNNLLSAALASDETGAKGWFAKIPQGSEKDNLRFNAAKALINSGEKEVATTWLRESLATIPGREKGVLATIIDDVIPNNSGDIPHYAALLPESLAFTAKDLEYTARNALYAGTGGLTAIASAIPDPAEQARLIATTLEGVTKADPFRHQLNSTDLGILSRKVAAMGFTGENAALVNAAIEAATNPPPSPGD